MCRHLKRDLLITSRIKQPVIAGAFTRHASDNAANATTKAVEETAVGARKFIFFNFIFVDRS